MESRLSGETAYREPGRFERYYIARSRLGLDSCVVVVSKYLGSDGYRLSREVLYPALSVVVSKITALSACVKGEGTDAVTFARIQSLDFDSLVEFSNSPLDNIAGIEAFIEAQWQKPLTISPGRPLWRLTVTSNNYVAFAWDHLLCDGLSAIAFHKALVKALNESFDPFRKDKDSVVKTNVIIPNDISMAPPIEDVADLSVSLGTLAREVAGVLIPGSWFQSKTWTGHNVVQEPQLSTKSTVKLIHISPEDTARLIAASRRNSATLTSTIHVCVVVVLSSLLRDPSKEQFRKSNPQPTYNSVSSVTAVSLRTLAHLAREAFGNFHAGFTSTEPLLRPAHKDIQSFPWELASSYSKSLREGLPKTRETIGTLKYLSGKYNEYFISKFGKKRQLGFEVSNLGAFSNDKDSTEALEDPWRLGDIFFAQDNRVIGSAMKVSVAGGADGSLGIGISWGEGSIDDSFGEDFVCDFLAIITKLGKAI